MTCTYKGDPQTYGLGLRLAFYLLWFAVPIAAYLARSEVPILRLTRAFFTGGMFLSLVVRASNAAIVPVDVYLGLLLASGPYWVDLPVMLVRVLGMGSPWWDLGRWVRVRETRMFRRVVGLGGIGILCFGMWFWTNGINTLPRDPNPTCQTWGFFFTKSALNASLFVAANVVFTILLLIYSTIWLAVDLGILPLPRWIAKSEKRFQKLMKRLDQRDEEFAWKGELEFIKTALDIAVLTVVVIAVELTIQWNNFDVNDLSRADQTIPLIVASGLVVHVLYVWVYPYHIMEIIEDISADLPEVELREKRGSDGSPEVSVRVEA
ncbi:hypothetical protein QBC47DRAFT_317019 [Echria macrotheca]|uniref:Uncharacterized protein n=1 Tax=Echria macrotheca TaxID=438768 RepID=A0AAJ0BGU6_9PEZI|nr:hypothetical protein QBC47DRAFT_317019 [Echria macrotheca]